MPSEVKIPAEAVSNPDPERLSLSIWKLFWISAGIVFLICLLSLTNLLESYLYSSRFADSIGTPMRDITAVCFLLALFSVISLYTRQPRSLRIILPFFSGLFIIVVSSFTIITWAIILNSGVEPGLTTIPLFMPILSQSSRMAMLSASIFFFIGIVLIMLTSENKSYSNLAHYICIPLSVASYIIPVSYILDVHFVHGIAQKSSSFSSGLAFCALLLALFALKPDTRFMRVYTSPDSGGIMARKLLPWLAVFPVFIGWLRTSGEHAGLFPSEVGTFLVEITYTLCFVVIVWLIARSVNLIDKEKHSANEALKKSYDELETRVQERTSELLELNKILDNEIRERIKAEDLVEAERTRTLGLLEKMPAYMILLTPDYHVLYSNQYFREIFGESNGSRCFEFLFNRSEPCEICETYKTLKEGVPHTWEWTGPNNRIYSIFDFPYADTDGSPLIMEMGIDVTDLKESEAKLVALNAGLETKVRERTRDIEKTNYRLNLELIERHQAEDALRKSEARLKELITAKDKFFSIIAHDLKNPFTSLLGSTEILLSHYSRMSSREVQELVQIVSESAQSGYTILQNLLDWSRSQTGMIVPDPESLHLKSIIDDNIEDLKYSSEKKNLVITSDVGNDLYVTADKNLLNTILRNLLSNAIKFTYNSGYINVSACQTRDEATISVKDTGIGVPESMIDELFRVETRYTRPGTAMEHGTGLGLKICRDFVEMLGGTIWVESTDNEGSTFNFTLPLR